MQLVTAENNREFKIQQNKILCVCDSPEQIQPNDSCPVSYRDHSAVSSPFLSGLHTGHLKFLIHNIEWKNSITEGGNDHKSYKCLLHQTTVSHLVNMKLKIFQSNPDSWSGLRRNHRFLKFSTAHQSISTDHLLLIILHSSSAFSGTLLGETLSETHYPQKKLKISNLLL